MGFGKALRTWEDGRSYRGEWHEDCLIRMVESHVLR